MKETEESSINPYQQTQSKVKSEPRGRQIKLKLEAKSCKLETRFKQMALHPILESKAAQEECGAEQAK